MACPQWEILSCLYGRPQVQCSEIQERTATAVIRERNLMSKLSLHIYGDEVLRKKTRFVKKFDKKLMQFIEDMFDLMYEAGGIGLAAPQVGILKKVLVVDTLEEGEQCALVNPKIIWSGGELVRMKEGCLSIPGVEAEVVRSELIRVRHDDPESGEELILEAGGLLSRVIQHEIDHLNGILFVDHLRPSQLSLINRKLQELTAA